MSCESNRKHGTAQCKSCGAPIVWAITPSGKAIPVDPNPVPNGNVELSVDAGQWNARVVQPQPGRSLYVSHFATCPNAARHRRIA